MEAGSLHQRADLHTRMIHLAVGSSVKNHHVKNVDFADFCEFASWASESRTNSTDKLETEYFTPAPMRDGVRRAENAGEASIVALDLDDLDAGDVQAIQSVVERANWRCALWSTVSHTEQQPRLRLVVELSRPVDREQFRLVYNALAATLFSKAGIDRSSDPQCARPEQPALVPPRNGLFVSQLDGVPADVDALLEFGTARELRSRRVLVAHDGAKAFEGGRNSFLTKMAGRLRRGGLDKDEIETALSQINRRRCQPPLVEDEVAAIARSIARYEPGDQAARIELETVPASWLLELPDSQRFVWEPRIPRGCVTLLTAEGGIGKSHLILGLAAHVACGRTFLDASVEMGRAAYIALEDSPDVVRRRLYFLHKALRERHGSEVTREIQSNLVVASMVGRQLHVVTQVHGTVMQTEGLDALVEACYGCDCVIIDPLARLHGIDENSNSAATSLLNACERVARETGAAVVLVHHVGKQAARDNDRGAHSARGASAISDAARSVLRLVRAEERDVKGFVVDPQKLASGHYLVLVHAKSNYAVRAENLWLERDESGRIAVYEPTPSGAQTHHQLLAQFRSWWCTDWAGRPFSRATVRESYRTIFFPKVARERACAVFDHAVEDGDLVHVAGRTRNPAGKMFVFRAGGDPHSGEPAEIPATPSAIIPETTWDGPAADTGGGLDPLGPADIPTRCGEIQLETQAAGDSSRIPPDVHMAKVSNG